MTPPEKSFVFAPLFNSPPDEANPNGHDATGAFHPGMAAYRRLYEGLGKQVVTFKFANGRGQSRDRRRQSIINAMQQSDAGPVRGAMTRSSISGMARRGGWYPRASGRMRSTC